MLKNWVKLRNFSFSLKNRTDSWNSLRHCFRSYTSLTDTNESEQQHDSLTLDKVVLNRRQEATRSIIVQVASENSFDELYRYCKRYGPLRNFFHYSIKKSNYILLEYDNPNSASNALSAGIYKPTSSEHECIPAQSRFLWFRANSGNAKANTGTSKKKLMTVNGTAIKNNTDLISVLLQANDLSDQIKKLYDETHLNDIGTRLRFLCALQLESLFYGIFPNTNVIPFGSSINGFGRMGSDLDLILNFNGDVEKESNGKRLVFHLKQTNYDKRELMQKYVEIIGSFIKIFIPGIENTNCISKARVPIIKYYHKYLDLNVDLTTANMSGFYMSELLHIFGEIDPRVRPLIFTIRQWAKANGITNAVAGGWLTNFSLTCMALCFLQRLEKPILPTLARLIKLARTEDIRTAESDINGTFLRDITKLDFKTENTDCLGELLIKFFDYYSRVDLQNVSLSLHTTEQMDKIDHAPIYIVNPLETHLNVSRNVSHKELHRFKTEVQNVMWLHESGKMEKNPSNSRWGLAAIFKSNNVNSNHS